MTGETQPATPRDRRYTSRKFLLAAGTILISSVLVWFGKISDGVFSTIVIAAISAYHTANVYQKKVEKVEKET